MPADTPDYMAPAWASCLYWAIGDPAVLADFRAAIGNKWTPPATGIDRMIDEATGADRAFIEAFVAWFNDHVWGPIEDEPRT